jgi:hypothetical protein
LPALGFVACRPAPRLIGGKPFGEATAQFELCCCQLALQRHDLEHDLRLHVVKCDQAIDFARLIGALPHAISSAPR